MVGAQIVGGQTRNFSLRSTPSSTLRDILRIVANRRLLQFLPFVIPLAYFFLLPPPTSFQGAIGTSAAYAAIPTADPTETPAEEIEESDVQASRGPKIRVTLSVADKLRLVRPLLLKYMLPLCKCIPKNALTLLLTWRPDYSLGLHCMCAYSSRERE